MSQEEEEVVEEVDLNVVVHVVVVFLVEELVMVALISASTISSKDILHKQR